MVWIEQIKVLFFWVAYQLIAEDMKSNGLELKILRPQARTFQCRHRNNDQHFFLHRVIQEKQKHVFNKLILRHSPQNNCKNLHDAVR
jgi:hypothetical protein